MRLIRNPVAPVVGEEPKAGGAEGTRTLYLLVANEALYQMSYRPKRRRIFYQPVWAGSKLQSPPK